MDKVSIEAFNSECRRWRSSSNKTELLGQRLMNAFSIGQPDPEIFYEKDPNKAAKKFRERYVSSE